MMKHFIAYGSTLDEGTIHCSEGKNDRTTTGDRRSPVRMPFHSLATTGHTYALFDIATPLDASPGKHSTAAFALRHHGAGIQSSCHIARQTSFANVDLMDDDGAKPTAREIVASNNPLNPTADHRQSNGTHVLLHRRANDMSHCTTSDPLEGTVGHPLSRTFAAEIPAGETQVDSKKCPIGDMQIRRPLRPTCTLRPADRSPSQRGLLTFPSLESMRTDHPLGILSSGSYCPPTGRTSTSGATPQHTAGGSVPCQGNALIDKIRSLPQTPVADGMGSSTHYVEAVATLTNPLARATPVVRQLNLPLAEVEGPLPSEAAAQILRECHNQLLARSRLLHEVNAAITHVTQLCNSSYACQKQTIRARRHTQSLRYHLIGTVVNIFRLALSRVFSRWRLLTIWLLERLAELFSIAKLT